MRDARVFCTLLFCCPFGAAANDDDEFLGRMLDRARAHMARLPDFVCAQTIERAERLPSQDQFRLKDRLHIEVTSLGGKERFAKAGGARFDDRELRDLVTRGIVSTGGHALFLRHVTQPGSAEFLPGADTEFEGRPVRKYEFQVPWDRSGYTISVPPKEARVGFRGSLIADPDTHEILRLEVVADEIPPELGFDRTRATMGYRLVKVGESHFPFAAQTETLAITMDGNEYRNRAELGACRQYSAESSISFASAEDGASTSEATTAPAGPEPPSALRPNLQIEIELADDIDFATAAPDTLFRATLAQPLRDGDDVIAPAGARVQGRVLELARVAQPVDRYEVVLRLDTVTLPDGGQIPLIAKLRDTGGAAGLMRQEKRLMPVFDKKRANRFSILVRETGRDQAVLYWDARRPQIRKGFRMRWLTESAE